MKICTVCGRVEELSRERCSECGSELRRRTVSDAVVELFDEAEHSTEAETLQCPRCDARIVVTKDQGQCPRCGALLTLVVDGVTDRPVLVMY